VFLVIKLSSWLLYPLTKGLAKMKIRFVIGLICILELSILAIAFEQCAYAYVDPGSGLLICQMGGSLLAGALFVLRGKLRKLLGRESPIEKSISPSDQVTVLEESGSDATQ
jgi:hypothetical protein